MNKNDKRKFNRLHRVLKFQADVKRMHHVENLRFDFVIKTLSEKFGISSLTAYDWHRTDATAQLEEIEARYLEVNATFDQEKRLPLSNEG